VKLLLQRNVRVLNRRDNRGRTAFLLAAQSGHVGVLKVLKENGQNMDEATSKNGWTGLHLAAENEHVETVKYLVANGAEKNAVIKDGWAKGLSAKQISEKKGKIKVLEFL
jgi:ankyrin repeat protein